MLIIFFDLCYNIIDDVSLFDDIDEEVEEERTNTTSWDNPRGNIKRSE